MWVLVLTAAAMLVWSIGVGENESSTLTKGDWMKRLIGVPGLLAILTFLVSTIAMQANALAAPPASTEQLTAAEKERPAQPFMAQVVGLEWLNPLQRRDYPTEWQVLWTQGLVRPNKGDDMVRTDPASFTTLQSVAGIAYGNHGKETFDGFYEKYVDKLLGLFGTAYVMNSKYFYTVAPDNKKDWRELAGIHVQFAIPERLDPVEAQVYLRKSIIGEFNIGNKHFKTLWSDDTPPDVHVIPGGANAGFTSLNNALDYLQANPDKTVWAMNWDAPSFPPKDAQLSENMVLLFLAGPTFKTERAPLAWIGKAATAKVQDFPKQPGKTRAVEAWKAAITTAAQNANISAMDIDYVIHDAGQGSDAASARIGKFAQSLTEALPEFDFQKQMFNTPALLGEMGAGTALTDVVLAIGRANHLGQKVLVAGTTDADHPVAVVVTPPAQVVPIDPDEDWFRARGGNNAYLPWWGRRFDTKYGMQGASF
jgi:hypothetical protein